MHRVNTLGVISWLTFGLPLVFATDLVKVERAIKKEPIYQSEAPQYGLLVFGPKTGFRIWLVLDRDKLYVDRNGNGDLTEEGEQVRCSHTEGIGPDARRWFDVGDLKVPGGGAKYPRLVVCTCLLSKEGQPDFHYCRVWVETLSCQHGACRLTTRQQEAPILHFAGPLVMFLGNADPLVRGREGEVMARIGSVGLGTALRDGQKVITTLFCQPFKGLEGFPAISTKSIPADLHPLAQVEFPNRELGGKPIVLRIPLNRRC